MHLAACTIRPVSISRSRVENSLRHRIYHRIYCLFDLYSSREGFMLIFQHPRASHTVACSHTGRGTGFLCLRWFSVLRSNPSTSWLRGSSRPPPVGLRSVTFAGSAADSSCMSRCKNSRCCRSRQARWGIKKTAIPYLPGWHKRELSSNDWRCNCRFSAFFPSSADSDASSWPWNPQKASLLGFVRAGFGDTLIFNWLMPPLLWFCCTGSWEDEEGSWVPDENGN